ncbi:MAG: pyridoxine 5'-phosphate synthase [Omnitrophica bacterium RBG_13_46_9]|nr:MAG: pyridoxine 5'-phosphate synthase [Omnitrophica bacterium RBG_13_46_9]
MRLLGVNIDHVATIRQTRRIDYPDPLEAALLCQEAGADSIVCHLREDRRHIQDLDLFRLKKRVKVKLNLEMAISNEIVDIALDVKPDQVTLVPEKREELTTEGGLDVVSQRSGIKRILKVMERSGIATSIFIDPDIRQIRASREIGAGMIELHTGSYANAKNRTQLRRRYLSLKKCAEVAKDLGLKVFAGHGLNYENIKPLVRIDAIEEYNIGHSIVSRAIFVGLARAVKDMKALLK